MIVPGPALFLQPHYDDVPLSCGGTAAGFAAAGGPAHIVTVFGSEIVDAMVGEFAAWKHSRWGLHDPDAVLDVRRAEDAGAARALGCDVRWLGWPDAIYRGDRYVSDAHLYGGLHPEEQAIAEHLANEVVQLPEWREGMAVFVPLGVGNHVDHQVVFEAGCALARRGIAVWAYEDLPYAIHTPAALPARLEQVGGRIGAGVAQGIAASLPRKLEAVACYASQLPVIFRFTDDFRGALTAHAAQVGGAPGPAERLWPVLPG